MLNFTDVTPTGYTIIKENGEVQIVTGKLYNNETSTAHIFRENNTTYEIFLDHYIARGDKICVYVTTLESNEWVIQHNFDAGVIVHVVRSDGLAVYPKNILILDSNQIKLNYDSKITGKAIVRVV